MIFLQSVELALVPGPVVGDETSGRRHYPHLNDIKNPTLLQCGFPAAPDPSGSAEPAYVWEERGN